MGADEQDRVLTDAIDLLKLRDHVGDGRLAEMLDMARRDHRAGECPVEGGQDCRAVQRARRIVAGEL